MRGAGKGGISLSKRRALAKLAQNRLTQTLLCQARWRWVQAQAVETVQAVNRPLNAAPGHIAFTHMSNA